MESAYLFVADKYFFFLSCRQSLLIFALSILVAETVSLSCSVAEHHIYDCLFLHLKQIRESPEVNTGLDSYLLKMHLIVV